MFSLGVFLVLLLALPLTGAAATRLGLHVTQEEKIIWQQRRTDNTNGINGVTYQAIYQNRLLPEADEFVAMSSPKDGFWAGYTGAGCHPGGQSPAPSAGPLGRYGRGNGAVMARAAFVYVLTGTTSYATAIKDALVTQAGTAGTDWTNTSKWCVTQMGGGAYLEIVPWFYRLLLAYDYLKAGGYTGWTAGEENTIRAWLLAGATFWKDSLIWGVQNNYVTYGGYPGTFDTPQNLTPQGANFPGFQSDDLWFGGPPLYAATYFSFYNQNANVAGLTMAAGVLFNDAVLIDTARKYFTGSLTVSAWSTGANPDFVRWHDCTPGCPGSMWDHAMSPMGWLITMADHLARTGDTSLYDFSVTSTAYLGGGGTVTLRKMIQLWARMVNKTVTLYGTTDGGDLVPERVLTWDSDNDPVPNRGNYADMAIGAANLYYNDAEVQTAMTRTLLSANNPFTGCNQAQYGGCFSGAYNFWPDLPFMYGNMQGVVNPYDLTASSPPIVTITTPTSDPTYVTTVSPLATLAGTATDSDGTVSMVTVSCPTCTPSNPAVTLSLPTWSVTNLGLAVGSNVITVMATDNTSETGVCMLTVDLIVAGLQAPRLLRVIGK